jgi:hypothetical protein
MKAFILFILLLFVPAISCGVELGEKHPLTERDMELDARKRTRIELQMQKAQFRHYRAMYRDPMAVQNYYAQMQVNYILSSYYQQWLIRQCYPSHSYYYYR